ncbi:hypothetical protein AB0M20_02645 [Actinoplanes sp. NPDC051633]|uniref:RCC1 domain-containing protein n=1 Tax=Actinoplanes sp. NPDC051633 TaxID=3155670 RepID=UPI0034450EEE
MRWSVVVAAVALSVPSPALAAPPDETSELGQAMGLQAKMIERLTGAPPVGALDVSDGFVGGSPIAAGGNVTCLAGLKYWCWGAGDSEPAKMALTREPGAVAAGRAHTCALDWFGDGDGGALYCWGDNAEGQVGDGTTTPRTAPVKVGSKILQVATGADHTCVIKDNQDVACWGRNDVGQLGTGAAGGSESTAQPVAGLGDVIDLAAGGDTTCAIDEDGAAWCWGSDADGQVGDAAANSGSTATPVKVDTTEEFTQIDVGGRHACAVTEDGAVWCWGSDSDGQLGDDAAIADHDAPVQVKLPPAVDVYTVSAGGNSTCTVTTLGLAMCWGDNDEGQLGVGNRTDRHVPAVVDQSALPESPFLALFGMKGSRIYQISVGDGHACAVDISSNTFCWGDNADGQLGDRTTDDHVVPEATALVPGAPTAVKAKAGSKKLAVSWTQPADFGVGKLQLYGVLAFNREDGSDCSTAKAISCTVSGLTNGQSYSVFAATVTDGGLSFSAAVTGTPVGPKAPGQGGGLPITGPPVSLLVMIGGALVATGLLLRLRGRS